MQQSSAFPPGAANNAVGVAARFNSPQMPGLVQPRPGGTGMSMGSAGQGSVGPQGRVLGGMPGGTGSRAPPGGAVMNGPRGPMPMGGAPSSSMGALTVGAGGAPVVGSGAAGRPPMGSGGYNPSGEILAMLKGNNFAGGGLGGAVAGGMQGLPPAGTQPQKLPGAAPGANSVSSGAGEEHELPNFGAEDFPALGGGLGSNPAGGLGMGGMGGMMQGGMIGIAAAAKIHQDFQMASEDFPALPGLGGAPSRGGGEDEKQHSGLAGPMGPGGVQQMGLGGAVQRPGSFGTSTQVKAGSVDRFGLLGLLSVIQMTNPDLNTLALGTDLTTLGLNLNSTESLYSTFASPWADGPSRREPEFSLPMCYYMQPPTLKSGHIQKFQLETLFYIFYMLPKDTLQAVAASELYSRDWKFHRDLKMWFHKQPSLGAMGADGKSAYNRPNTYIYFDVNVWERRTYYDQHKNLEQGFLSEEEVRLK